jgi:hypothetical protein
LPDRREPSPKNSGQEASTPLEQADVGILSGDSEAAVVEGENVFEASSRFRTAVERGASPPAPYAAPHLSEEAAPQPKPNVFWYETVPDTTLLWEQVDADRKLDDISSWQENVVVGSATVAAAALSAGYALWTFRGGCLVASFISSVPVWRSVDPLPILDDFGRRVKRDAIDVECDDDDSLQSMVSEGAAAATKAT